MSVEALHRPVVAGSRRRWIALVVVCLAMLMNALDGSVVNVALPRIQQDLGFSQSDLSWVVNAYMIAFGSFLLLAGRLGDLVGRKRVFLTGVAVFTAASALCGVADDQAMLIVARFIQGLGGAISSSVIIALIVTEFPEPGERARAMSAYIFVAVGGGSLGLLVGGALTQTVNWHWIFFINLPIGVATFVLGAMLLEENAGHRARPGARLARLDPHHRRAHGRHLRDHQDDGVRLALGAHARVRRRRDRHADRVLRARVADREPDPAAPRAAHPRTRGHRASCAGSSRPASGRRSSSARCTSSASAATARSRPGSPSCR